LKWRALNCSDNASYQQPATSNLQQQLQAEPKEGRTTKKMAATGNHNIQFANEIKMVRKQWVNVLQLAAFRV